MRSSNAKSPPRSSPSPIPKKAQIHCKIDSCRNNDYVIFWVNLLDSEQKPCYLFVSYESSSPKRDWSVPCFNSNSFLFLVSSFRYLFESRDSNVPGSCLGCRTLQVTQLHLPAPLPHARLLLKFKIKISFRR